MFPGIAGWKEQPVEIYSTVNHLPRPALYFHDERKRRRMPRSWKVSRDEASFNDSKNRFLGYIPRTRARPIGNYFEVTQSFSIAHQPSLSRGKAPETLGVGTLGWTGRIAGQKRGDLGALCGEIVCPVFELPIL